VIALRPYQKQSVHNIRQEWQASRPTLLVLPTGGGKTHVTLSALSKVMAPGIRVLWAAHRSELLDQTAERMRQHRLPAPGFVQAGRDEAYRQFVLGTTQTLSRIQRLIPVIAGGPIHYYVRDEAHRSLSDTDLFIMRMLRQFHAGVRILGLTATPWRTDGQPLGLVYESVAHQVTPRQLIDDGYLVPPREVVVQLEDLNLYSIPQLNGDFRMKMVGELLSNPPTHRKVFNTWLKHGSGRPTLGFTASVAQARELAEYFRGRGVAAAYMSGETTEAEEQTWDEGGMLAAFGRGNIQVLFNCYKLVEGVDLPNCSCILWIRPTLSPLVFQQGVGRGLRLFPGKTDCLVLTFNPIYDRLVGVTDILDGFDNPLGSWNPASWGVSDERGAWREAWERAHGREMPHGRMRTAQKVDLIMELLEQKHGG
jgi:ATP-dependent helicase IRC3